MFNSILGNENVKNILEKNINNGNIAHSYMFIGQAGIGKFTFAKEFAKAMCCLGVDKPCGKCEACHRFDNQNNPDIIIIDEEEKSIKTDTIKNLVKNIYEKPIQSEKKIYIINDSEKMTKEAQNGLLKTLEEPPEYGVIILITQNENLLLNTIKSRCTKIRFDILNNNQIMQILDKKYGYKEISDVVLNFAEGSVEKAVSIYGKEEIYINLENTFKNLQNIDLIDLLNKKEMIFKDKDNIVQILNYINIVFYREISYNIRYLNCIKMVEEAKDRLNKNSNFDMTIDNLLLKVWEEING